MPVTPLKPTDVVYNRTQHCSRVEILRDPAVVVDYGLNKQDYIKSDFQNLYAESEGISAQSSVFINSSGSNIQVNPGYGIYRNFIFNVSSILSISASGQPNSTTYFLVLKVVEKRFTSGATNGGIETDDNALEGVPGNNPYGNLWPIVQSGYDPDNCLQIDVSNESAFDTHNEWRFKWEWQLLSAVPSSQIPVAGKNINIFYTTAAEIEKDASGNITVFDKIYSNRIVYRDKNNLFTAGQTMSPTQGVSIVDKSEEIDPFGLVTNQILQIDGSSDLYILDLDNADQIGATYNPLTGSILPGIDIVSVLPNKGVGNTFALYVKSVSNPLKRLRMSNFAGVQVTPDYPYEATLPGNTAFRQVDLYHGSITVFTVLDGKLRIVDGTYHLSTNVYGNSDYSNTSIYPSYTTHKGALDAISTYVTGNTFIPLTGLTAFGIVFSTGWHASGISAQQNFNLTYNAHGDVEINMVVQITAGATISAFRLPATIRPTYNKLFIVWSFNNDLGVRHVHVTIGKDGFVTIQNISDADVPDIFDGLSGTLKYNINY